MLTADQTSLKYGDIVKVNGALGIVIPDRENKVNRFWDRTTPTYNIPWLQIIERFEETTHEEKVAFLSKNFSGGTVVQDYHIAEYLILEYVNDRGETRFRGYRDYRDKSNVFSSLDRALIGLIAEKYEGLNGSADLYFARSVGMSDC